MELVITDYFSEGECISDIAGHKYYWKKNACSEFISTKRNSGTCNFVKSLNKNSIPGNIKNPKSTFYDVLKIIFITIIT